MNQILMVDNPKKNKKQKRQKKQRGSSAPVGIKNIVRFFAVCIMLFGFCIIGHSSYALYTDAKGNNTEDLPEVNMTRVNDTLIVNVDSVYTIDRFIYYWENSEQTSKPEGKTSFQEEIILPSGNDVLTIVLEDETGRAVTYIKEIIIEGIDIVKPEITITEGENQTVLIEVTDETAIQYITYQIDGGEIIRVDRIEGDNERTLSRMISNLQVGSHTIVVNAYDSNGNSDTLQRTVNVVTSAKPRITTLFIDQENGTITVGVEDDIGVQSLEIVLNGEVSTLNNLNQTRVENTLNLIEGTNTIQVTVTNTSGQATVGETSFDYVR